ncbi:unnamed protein product [Meloidogyne enterolobii]|uniref:Uncharacterized protein n=1 Tax=Meloidogyne enterolobii TaxID=390850 RepID=A0ACB0YQY1_MELEN
MLGVFWFRWGIFQFSPQHFFMGSNPFGGVIIFLTLFLYSIFNLNFPADICLPLHPIVQCKTEKSARFSSLHALCHAFAVSYKMNIQIGLVMETTELICNQNVFLEFEALASLKREEKSEINFFEIGRIDGDDEVYLLFFPTLPG